MTGKNIFKVSLRNTDAGGGTEHNYKVFYAGLVERLSTCYIDTQYFTAKLNILNTELRIVGRGRKLFVYIIE